MGCRTSITIMWTKKKKKEDENLEELKNKSKHHNKPQPKEPQIFTTNLHPHLRPTLDILGPEARTKNETFFILIY